jgi:hypothetical protein
MKSSLFISITLSLILSTGCQEKEEEQKDEEKRPPIVINQIEKKITNQKSSLGCKQKKRHGIVEEECTQKRQDSAQFILTILEKDLNYTQSNQVTGSIRDNLNHSLKKIEKEKSQKDELKNNLIALIKEADSPDASKRTKLKDFINTLDDAEVGISNRKKINSIKNKLENLVELKESEIKPQEVKTRLKKLLSNVIESENTLIQTQQSLKTLVENVEKEKNKSAKKFANALLEDVSRKKITILNESDDFFTIKVQEGDNLSILAKRYYNDSNKFKIIYNANRDKISENYEIYPNSELLIPKI